MQKKRKGTRNLFTWKPKQNALTRLIKKVERNNYKFNKKDIDKLAVKKKNPMMKKTDRTLRQLYILMVWK